MLSSTNFLFRRPFLVGVKDNLTRCNSSVPLKYFLYGEALKGDPVIFLHGLLGSRHNLKCLGRHTCTLLKRPVIVADARNHGQSPHAPSHTYMDLASDVEGLMKSLDYSRASLVGHSMGGRTAMTLALTQPDKVQSLVVLDISPISKGGQNDEFLFISGLLDKMAEIKFEKRTNLRQARRLVDEHLSGLDESLRRFVKTNLIEKRGRALWRVNLDALRQYYTSDISRFPEELSRKKYNGPTLFIGGELSNFIPRDHEPAIREMFPNCSLTYVENARHNVHHDDPDTVLELLITFFRKHSHN